METETSLPDMEDLGYVHSEESLSCVDGPGIRYVVFMQGCQMRCRFCSNPDTWRQKRGRRTTREEVCRNVLAVRRYLEPNGGGVTVTGGEPMLQSGFVSSLFRRLREEGLTTCIDTCGRGEPSDWDAVLPHTDRVLFCIKHADPARYKALTMCEIDKPLRFAEELRKRMIPFRLRYVLIPGYTDDDEGVEKAIDWAARQPSLECVELLPYHELGVNKWKEMGLDYPLLGVKPPDNRSVRRFKHMCKQRGVPVICGR